MNKFTYVDENLVSYTEMKAMQALAHKDTVCPVCLKRFEVGEQVELTINNYKLFPNCFIHCDCIGEDRIATYISLRDSYRALKEQKDKMFAQWRI